MLTAAPNGHGPRAAAVVLLAAVLSGVPAAAAPLDPVWLESFDAAWQIVNETYYDPEFNGVDWQSVRRELRPRAEAATSPDAVRAVIREMIARLKDSHFALIPEGAGAERAHGRDASGDPGIDVRYSSEGALVVAVAEDSAADAAGVRPGWTIRSIDGRPVDADVAPLKGVADPALLAFEAWRAITERLRGPIGTAGHVSFVDANGSSRELRIERRAETGESVKLGTFPALRVRTTARALRSTAGVRVGYIRFNVWLTPVDGFVARAVDEYRDAAGIVIDLRGNPGGLAAMIMGIAGQFTAERVSLGEMRTREETLKFYSNPRRVSPDGRPVTPFAGRVAILTDGLTGSASECFAGGMQAIGRARVFGERSMGQALPALFDRLPSGDVLVHAYADFVTATGGRLEGRGVEPDVSAPWTRAALLEGHDTALERAVEWAGQR